MRFARNVEFRIKNGKIIEEQVDNEAVDPTKIIDACQLHNKK